MRRSTGLAVLVLALAAPATAAPPAKAPALAAAPLPPCQYIQPQVKQCAVSEIGGLGTFDVTVAPPASLVVTFDEPVVGMQPPPPSSFRASISGSTATVLPIRRDPMPGATVHFDTATVHVTLNLKPGATADTQLLIVDPRKAARDDEVERRVKEAAEGLEEKAEERAVTLLLGELAAGQVELVDPDTAPTRHDQVVLRAKKVLRLGARRLLLCTIDNRTGEDLEIRTLRLFVGPDGAAREIPHPAVHVASPILHADEEVAAAIALPPRGARDGERVRVRVEFTDEKRNLELGGIRTR
jgi:hypothetical protein